MNNIIEKVKKFDNFSEKNNLKIETAYKVVNINYESYTLGSLPADNWCHKYKMQYRLNKTVKKAKDCYGIMCFNNISEAINFIRAMSETGIILKIVGIKSRKQPKYISEGLSTIALNRFYKSDKRKYIFKRETPPGTVFFDKITPIKII